MSKIKTSLAVILGAVLLGIAGCDVGPSKGKDGYKFESKEYEKVDLEISFVILQDQKQFDEQAKIWAPGVEGLQAFGRLQPKQNRCIIYIKDPTWQYVPEFIGHEVAHCIWGRWHGKRNAQEAKQGHRPETLPYPENS